jgi:hypothetical protein
VWQSASTARKKQIYITPYSSGTATPTGALEQVGRVAQCPEHTFVDRGYRGHGYDGDCEVHVDRQRRGTIAKSMWKWMKRRAAVEPGIGHLHLGILYSPFSGVH